MNVILLVDLSSRSSDRYGLSDAMVLDQSIDRSIDRIVVVVFARFIDCLAAIISHIT